VVNFANVAEVQDASRELGKPWWLIPWI